MVQRDRELARFLRVSGVAGATVALFAVWVAAGPGGETSVRYVGDLAAAALVATTRCFSAGSKHAGRLRLFWWLLATSSMLRSR